MGALGGVWVREEGTDAFDAGGEACLDKVVEGGRAIVAIAAADSGTDDGGAVVIGIVEGDIDDDKVVVGIVAGKGGTATTPSGTTLTLIPLPGAILFPPCGLAAWPAAPPILTPVPAPIPFFKLASRAMVRRRTSVTSARRSCSSLVSAFGED